ncbi:MAG: hypothetical protein COU25_01225 [Candidatus Levybacteria bacterium CG10_big_fil_rev_8_21_14_0_10_35_13]|nr:MAG: hypothetical protein COU25_01225 [Candidatus Levybacteria bacterium CG10_big_fil_rev_8_21_14_0_10_35_13]
MDNSQNTFQNAGNVAQVPSGTVPPVQQAPPTPAPMGNTNVVTVGNPSEKPPGSFSAGKKIIKIFLGLIFILAVISVVIFIAISKAQESLPGKGFVSFWGIWEDARVVQVIINDYEKQNPGVKISYTKQDIKQYRESLTVRIDNGTGPDIFTYHNTWYPMILSVLSPFPANVISKEEFAKTFYPVAQKDLIKNGAIYGVPFAVDTLVMYINTDLFKSAGVAVPTTWNDFMSAARVLTVKDENGKIKTAGAAMGTYDNINYAPDILSLLFLQNGADLNDINSHKERVEGALNFYTSFAADSDNVWDDTLDPSLLAFSKGNLAMYFGYSWDYFSIKKFNSNLSFQVVPVPQLADQPINLASYWALGVSSKTQYQKEAFDFIKYFMSKEVQQKLYAEESKERDFGQPHARVDLAQSLSNNPNVYPFVLQAPTAHSSYFVDGTNDNGLNQQLNTYLGDAVRSMYKGGSSEAAFDTLLEGITPVLQQYGIVGQELKP